MAVAEIGLERTIPDLLTDELWAKQCHFLKANFIWQSNLIYLSIFTVEKPMIKFLLFKTYSII